MDELFWIIGCTMILHSTKEYALLKKGSDEKKPYSLRYVGSMVADVHR